MSEELRFKTKIFHSLAHPIRVAIVDSLRDGELSKQHLLARLKEKPTNLAQHLSYLREAGIILGRREGDQLYYRLGERAFPEIHDLLHQCFLSKIAEARAELEALLED
ncbi:MAG: metalloregulator ArsR/SmtB family transcription factor [Armatimonas sp.]